LSRRLGEEEKKHEFLPSSKASEEAGEGISGGNEDHNRLTERDGSLGSRLEATVITRDVIKAELIMKVLEDGVNLVELYMEVISARA
jgi:hypothetical protein